jgi:hypothetical protein
MASIKLPFELKGIFFNKQSVKKVIGYIILLIMKRNKFIGKANIWLIVFLFGFLSWVILLSLNSRIGNINSPWSQGTLTVLPSLIVFILFSYIIIYTIRNFEN